MRRGNSTKSTTSFRSALERLEHIDPAVASRDAHLAATLSFARSAPMGAVPPRPRRPTDSSPSDDTSQDTNRSYTLNSSPEQEGPGPALRRRSMQDIKTNSPSRPAQSIRAPKSMSFLHARSTTTGSCLGRRQENDHAVKEAEDSFRRDVENQKRLKSRPSMFFASIRKQSHNSIRMRKSMRDLADSFTSSPSTPAKTPDSLRKKARKVSSGLRFKLKTLFRRNKKHCLDPEDSRPDDAGHDQAMEVGDADEEDAYMDIVDHLPTDECSISQVPSRVPSLHNASSAQRLRSRQGSIESLDAERKVSDEKSRVTSWTSSGAPTLNSQCTSVAERERQRLSVIKEFGPHVSSSSFRRPPTDRYNPYEFEALSPQQANDAARSGPVVDSQRVYSALMNRLSEAKQKDLETNSLKEVGIKDGPGHEARCSRTSSDLRGSMSAQADSPPTIRCVLRDDDVFRDAAKEQVEIGDTISEESDSSQGSVIHRPQDSVAGSTLASYRPYPGPAVGDDKNQPPVKAPVGNIQETLAAPKTLSTRSSAFFGSPTCHLFRTTSPYRRALQESMRENHEPPAQIGSPPLPTLDLSMLSTSRHPSQSLDDDPRLAYSESIYSDQLRSPRNEFQTLAIDDKTAPKLRPQHPRHKFSGKIARLPQSNSSNSDASIERETHAGVLSDARYRRLMAQSAPAEPITYKPTMPTDRTASYASSVEWKTFLSANLSRTDLRLPSAKGKSLHEVRYAKPSMPRAMGHVREGAQIEDSGSPLSYRPTGSESKKLFTPLRTANQNSQKVSSASRVEGWKPSKLSTPTRDENTAPSSDSRASNRTRGVYWPPPIPPRSSLRAAPSMPLMQTHPPQSSIPVRPPERGSSKMRSAGTLPNVTSETQPKAKTRSPVKLVRRAAARRGLKSSSSSPGFSMALEQQFGPMLGSDLPTQGSPRRRQNTSGRGLLDSGDSNGTENIDSGSFYDWEAQKTGSHHLVENFLSGRRAPNGGDSTVFL